MSTHKLHEASTQEIGVKAAHEDHSRHEAQQDTESPVALSQARSNSSFHAQTRLVSAGQWMREVTEF
jgi:hypothetical protein